jgi:Sec-independent protein translocase protein TatA
LSRVEDPEDNSVRAAGAKPPPSPFDSLAETNAEDAKAHDPSVHELLQSTRDALARESELSRTPFGVSISTVVAVAVSALIVLALVILIPGLRRSDTASSFLADVQRFKAALSSQSQDRPPQDRQSRDRQSEDRQSPDQRAQDQQARDQQAQDPQKQDQPSREDTAKPATEQFQRLFALSKKPVAPSDPDPSDKLLQQFMQWRLKNGSAEHAQ